MKKGTATAIVALLAVVLSACGSSGTETVVQTVTVEEAAADATDTEVEPAPTEESEPDPAEVAVDDDDCVTLDITPGGKREGRCVTDGQNYAMVNRGTELRLKTVAVRVDGISFSDTIASDISSETASGTFATIALTVRNRSNRPQSFANGFTQQTMLTVGKRQFTQDFDVENGGDQQSFAWQGRELQPGAEQSGHIVFDLPRKVAIRLEQDGQIVVVDFGVDLSYDDSAREIGVLRLAR